MPEKKTVVITGASYGIGAGILDAFLERGYNVVATSRTISKVRKPTPKLALVDGDIGKQETASEVADVALRKFGAIDVLVANAGIFRTKPFTDFTLDDLNELISTNLLGVLFISQLVVREMLKQKSGSVIITTAALAEQPIAGVNASYPMIIKGGLNALIRSLAIEYAMDNIRFNAVSPGVVDTPMHANSLRSALTRLQPMGSISSVQDVSDAVLYLAEANQVTGEILHVDGGSHAGRW